MRNSAPFKIAILALMLAVSHVALISHVSAHFAPDLEQCELCVSGAQTPAAIVQSHQAVTADGVVALSPSNQPQCAVPARPVIIYHQRAPPTSFS